MVENGIIDERQQHTRNLRAYFDGAGFERWTAIYDNAESLSYVRQTVQDGHASMLQCATEWLTETDGIETVFDAGCGTGLFSVMVAQAGRRVTAMDLSPRMVQATQAAAQVAGVADAMTFHTGDVQELSGPFDAVACFDVLVHYPAELFAGLCAHLARQSGKTLLFTYAPYNRWLAMLHWVGGHFPQGERRTEIQMIREATVTDALASAGMHIQRTKTISRGFYHVRLVQAVRP